MMKESLKNLPIGIQDFREIIEGNYVYVDKTKEALELIKNYKYIFLSRPRRFGKSLFLSTLKEIFQGNRELFKGLYIYDKYHFPKHPVIHLSWEGDLKTLKDIKETALRILKQNKKRLGIDEEIEFEGVGNYFAFLIEMAYEKYGKRVVILIDEYDKPILDNIENFDVAYEAREFLREFYGVIKGMDEYIRFVFITGVSRFSKVSIFSGLNNLRDISLEPKFAYICGYLHENLEREFKEHLKGVDLERVREWYNGYNFLGEERVYNPFDILLFIDSGFEFKSYWFETGTPTFLIKLILQNRYFLPELEGLQVGDEIVESFDIESLSIETVLFQAGYLTIESVQKEPGITIYTLNFPNLEVKSAFNRHFLNYLIKKGSERAKNFIKLYQILKKSDLDGLKDVFYSFFASIPHDWHRKSEISGYEGFYGSVFYAYFSGLGVDVRVEDATSKGRLDMTVFFGGRCYLFEFKVVEDKGTGEALRQLKEKRYYEKYLTSCREVYLIGVEFSKKEKNIVNFEWERIK